MKMKKLLFGENSLTKIAQVCDSEKQASQVAQEIQAHTSLAKSQVKILSPQEYDSKHTNFIGLKLEPESAGIFATILKTHIFFGTLGAIVGLLLYTYLSNHVLIESTPVQSFIAIVGFSITFGMLLAGFISLRPDHIRMIVKVKEFLEKKKWIVVLHPLNEAQARQAIHHLSKDKMLRTL